MNNETRMWLCRFYRNRGLGLTDEQWTEFRAFAEREGFTDEPPPGRRVDGRDKWRIYFGLED